jgi:glutamate-1-semialdehyde 2,1-aminomutase
MNSAVKEPALTALLADVRNSYTMTSEELYARACEKIPGGVNSPVRAWRAVGGVPRFMARGAGSRIYDVEGNAYIDFVNSWGALILGHAQREVVAAVQAAAARGTTYGAPTENEVRLAEQVCQCYPAVQKIRMVSSGTEATMSALRLARAYTGRDKVVKFDGCYHGHSDGLLVKAGSGVATLALPDSPGVPAAVAGETLVAVFNHSDSLQNLFRQYPREIAAVIVEPVCGNMGVIPPDEGFLQRLRELTTEAGVLLIFDEVITGFRVSLAGAQGRYRVEPDLTCLGKVLGGGLPLAAFGGGRAIMNLLAPEGPVYQAGTLSGNPLAVAAGLATLEILGQDNVYTELERRAQLLTDGLTEVLRKRRVKAVINRVGSMLTVFFGAARVRSAADARTCNRELFASFFHGMLQRGIYFPPSPFEAAFVSLAHTTSDIEDTVRACDDWAAHAPVI